MQFRDMHEDEMLPLDSDQAFISSLRFIQRIDSAHSYFEGCVLSLNACEESLRCHLCSFDVWRLALADAGHAYREIHFY